MTEDDFFQTVRREAQLDSTDAARAVTTATLATLGERISDGEAEDLARDLPDPLARTLVEEGAGEAEPFSLEEFTGRVSDRAGIDESRVAVSARAVATALSEVAGAELETAREQLPAEFDLVFEPEGPITEATFLDRVRESPGVDSESEARTAITATLRTLGERLTEGEADDLAFHLPDPFAAELTEPDDESATDLSFDEFVRRVSQRASVEMGDARVQVRAVGSTLAEAVSERELEAAKEQLPDPFGTLFDRPTEDGEDAGERNEE